MAAATDVILAELARLYPATKPTLNFSNPFETLIAAILSAQCTDVRVNMVTPELFAKFPDVRSIAALEPEQLEPHIRLVGLYHAKSRNIVDTCRIIVERHDGEVPGDFDSLMKLPGVGRKVANVVLSNAFGQDAFAVDTHVHRVANRLGLANSKTPEQTERQLTEIVPRGEWGVTHLRLIYHGRAVCHSRKPDCADCTLNGLCAFSLSEEAVV